MQYHYSYSDLLICDWVLGKVYSKRYQSRVVLIDSCSWQHTHMGKKAQHFSVLHEFEEMEGNNQMNSFSTISSTIVR